MNYDDELERSRAKRSRKKETVAERKSQAAFRNSEEERMEQKKRISESRKKNASSEPDHSWDALMQSGSRGTGHQTPSGHRKRGRKNKRNKVIIGVVIGFLAVALLVAGAAYGYFSHLLNKSRSQNEFSEEKVANLNLSQADRDRMEKGFWTIAVFGLDSRDGSTGKGNQSDVIMIVNINRETGEIKLASVFRDTYLNVSEKNTYNKINAAYAMGGPEQAVAALNKNLDLNITDYVTFNWKAVATAINILGGVDIEISKAEHYYINAFITETVKGTGIGSVQLKSPGMHHMDGVQAVAYGRLRLMDTDYARTERQKIVIQKAFEKAKQADLKTLNDLVGNMFAMCATSVDFGDIAAMVPNVSKYHLGESTGFPMARDEKKIKIGSSRADCVIPQTLESNVISLHEFLFGEENYKPSSTVKSISNKIAEVSGLHDAGKEAGPARTDGGYVPKATTAAPAATTPAETESEERSADESSSTESRETLEGESESGSESESSQNGNLNPSESSGVWPSRHQDPHESSTQTDNRRPSSPMDMTTEPEQPGGPGIEATVPEASMSPAGPASQATTADQQTSVIVPSSSAPGQGNPTGNSNMGGSPAGNSQNNTPAGNHPQGNGPADSPAENSPADNPANGAGQLNPGATTGPIQLSP